jgi:alpha/beta superfamily hydrolase
VNEKLRSVMIPGPAGRLEGLWKEARGAKRGSAVFAHPHPLHGGTMHNKVVYRTARALTAAGWETLRFNFRGVGLSEGSHDEGRGEVGDFRAALTEAQQHGGLPLVAGGFSFGSAVALKAIQGDVRIAAFVGAGLPVGIESGAGLPLPTPSLPALFLVGEQDTFGPPAKLRKFLAGSPAQIVEIPGADHFFEGKLPELEAAIHDFALSIQNPKSKIQNLI